MADNISDALADRATAYQISLLRVEAGMRKKVVAQLEELEADIIGTLARNKGLAPGKKKQLEKVLAATQDQVSGIYKQINKLSKKDLGKVAQLSTKKTTADLSGALGVSMGPMQLSASQVTEIVRGPNIEGNPIEDWWTSQDDKTTRQIHGEIQKGMFLGEGVDELTRRIRGTKANAYRDGIIQGPKHEAEAITRTAVQSISNTARLETLENGSEVVKGIEWVATLDSRTTPTCRALDGLQWSLPDYKPIGHNKAFPGPIAHWGCRSTQIAVTRSWSELAGKKIPEADTGSQTYKEAFERALAAQGKTPEEIEKIEANQRASMDGTVSANLDFDAWARKKGDDYIREILGPGRFELWKENNLTMRDLTDQSGRELTIAQLEQAIEQDALPVETEGFEFEPLPDAEERAEQAAIDEEEMKRRLKNRPKMRQSKNEEDEPADEEEGEEEEEESDSSDVYGTGSEVVRIGQRRLPALDPEQVAEPFAGKYPERAWLDEGGLERLRELDGQDADLAAWAKGQGIYLNAEDLDEFRKKALATSAGGEHDVIFVRDEDTGEKLAIRFTKDDQYGRAFATPWQYLNRWRDSNELSPNLPTRVIGYTQNGRGNGVIITAQPFVRGKHPTFSALEQHMEERGWEKNRQPGTGGLSWIHRERKIKLFDVKPDNVIEDEDGEIHMIDVWIERTD